MDYLNSHLSFTYNDYLPFINEEIKSNFQFKDQILVEEAQAYWLDQTKELVESDRSAFMQYINKIAQNILHELGQMSSKTHSAQEMKIYTQKALNELHLNAQEFLLSCHSYHQSKEDVTKGFKNLQDKIASTQLNFSSFETTPKDHFLYPYQKSRIEENIALARTTATVVNSISTVMNKTIEVTGEILSDTISNACKINSTTEQFCNKVNDIGHTLFNPIVETGKDLLHKTRIDEFVKDAQQAYVQTKEHTMPNILAGFDIPKEMASQYVDDALSIAPYLAPIPTYHLIKQGFNKASHTAKMSLSSPRPLLLENPFNSKKIQDLKQDFMLSKSIKNAEDIIPTYQDFHSIANIEIIKSAEKIAIRANELAPKFTFSRLYKKQPKNPDSLLNQAERLENFIRRPKEFKGVLNKDLMLMQHPEFLMTHTLNSKNVHWVVPIKETYDAFASHEAVKYYKQHLFHAGEVTYIRIPAGQSIQFLYGRVKPISNNWSKSIIHLQFQDIDPQWILKTSPIDFVRSLSVQDLGPVGLRARPQRLYDRIDYEGKVFIQGKTMKIQVDFLQGEFDNFIELVNHVKKTAKSTGADTLQIKASIVNEKLLRVLTKRYNCLDENGYNYIEINLK